MSYSEWPSDLFFGDFYDTYIAGRPYEQRYAKLLNMDPSNTTATDLLDAERLIKRNFLIVNILRHETKLEYRDNPRLTPTAFVSQLGGALNLWAGITVVVIAEVIEFLCELVYCRIYASASSHKLNRVLSQWETTLHCNVVSSYLGPYLLYPFMPNKIYTACYFCFFMELHVR